MKKWKGVAFVLLGILLIAFVLRVINLTIIPVFADEAIYIRWAQVMRSVPELRFLPLSDGKQPLFMWLIIPFFKVFRDPLIAGRMVSVLSGVGTTLGVFVLTRLIFPNKKNIPLLASFMYAISPFALFFDRMALADSLLSFFGIWTFIFTVLAVRYQRLDSAMVAGFMLGGALITKSPALYFSLLLPSTMLTIPWDKKKLPLTLMKTIGFWSITLIIGYAFYNALRLGPNFHLLSSRNLDYVYPLSHIIERPFDPLKPFLMEVVRWFWTLGPGVLIILVSGSIALLVKKYPKQILFLTILIFVPILISAEFAKVFTARYIFFSIPYLMILASTILMVEKQKWILGFIGVFIIHALFIDVRLLTDPQRAVLPRSERSGYLEEWTAGYGIKETATLMRDEYAKDPNTKIVVGTEGYFGTLPDGLQMYLNDLPQITVIGVGQPIRDVPQSLKESKMAGNKTYLVVNSTRFLGDANESSLTLLKNYPKAERPDRTREELLLFEVK